MKHLLRALLIVLALAPAAVSAQSRGLTVHGYLTQGYADASDIPIYGIRTEGTSDYRALALQFRYALNPSDAVVVQFAHRRLGRSAIQEFEPDLALDWGFFQKRWQGNSIRVGRVPMPRGLFNEVRDVGVLFPFFRASKAFYSEGVETVDGVSIGRSVDLGSTGFSLDLSAYAGEFTTAVEFVDTEGLFVLTDRLYGATGGQLQIHTPIPGVRLSTDYVGAEYDSGGDFSIWTTSADATRDRWFARAEYESVLAKTSQDEDDIEYIAWYAQAGVGLTEKLWVNAQYEVNDITSFRALPSPPFPSPEVSYDNIRDTALGVLYKFSPLLILKAEYHWFEGYQLDEPTLPIDPMTGQGLPPRETNYVIISLSAAF